MYLVNDVHALFHHGWGENRLIAQGTNVVHSVVGGRVHLHDVHHGAVINTQTGAALVAGAAIYGMLAVDGLGQYFCAGGFSRAAGPYEQIGVGKPAGAYLAL